MKLSTKVKIESKELSEFKKDVSKLSSVVTRSSVEAAHSEASEILTKHYGLPKEGGNKRSKPSIQQVLKITHGHKDSLLAQDKPISMLRFLVGRKSIRMKGVRRDKRKPLMLELFPGQKWKKRSAFSGMGRNKNRRIFNKIQIDGKYLFRGNSAPSVFSVLKRDENEKRILESVEREFEENVFKSLITGPS